MSHISSEARGQEYFPCRHKKNFTTLARGFVCSQNIAAPGTHTKKPAAVQVF
jgi:hypothetical protein